MTTTTPTEAAAPAPSKETQSNPTGARPWAVFYSIVAGIVTSLIGFGGMTLGHTTLVFSAAFMLALVILWLLQRIKRLELPPAGIQSLIVTGIVAFVAPLLGSITGLLLFDIFRASLFGVILIISGFGTIGLLIAISHQRVLSSLICLVCLAVTLMFMTQWNTSMVIHEQNKVQQQQQLKQRQADNCKAETETNANNPGDFVAEGDCK
jgi:hypothetical protein